MKSSIRSFHSSSLVYQRWLPREDTALQHIVHQYGPVFSLARYHPAIQSSRSPTSLSHRWHAVCNKQLDLVVPSEEMKLRESMSVKRERLAWRVRVAQTDQAVMGKKEVILNWMQEKMVKQTKRLDDRHPLARRYLDALSQGLEPVASLNEETSKSPIQQVQWLHIPSSSLTLPHESLLNQIQELNQSKQLKYWHWHCLRLQERSLRVWLKSFETKQITALVLQAMRASYEVATASVTQRYLYHQQLSKVTSKNINDAQVWLRVPSQNVLTYREQRLLEKRIWQHVFWQVGKRVRLSASQCRRWMQELDGSSEKRAAEAWSRNEQGQQQLNEALIAKGYSLA